MLTTLAISNYRSLRELVVPLAGLNVVSGANGAGKSSLYRSLRLLADAAQGGLVASLAREGGLPSTLWAGPEKITREMRRGEHPIEGLSRQHPVRLRLGFAADELGYAIELGLPIKSASAFELDPQIKRECAWGGAEFHPSALLVDRHASVLKVRGEDGQWSIVSSNLPTFDGMMQYADPRGAPELLVLRERIRSWRFYDHLRADAGAPARTIQVGTHTPVLAHDGADLAAAMQTIREIGDPDAFDHAVDDAFPGATVEVRACAGRFELHMAQPGMLRTLAASELSDGTLRYLLLVAALLSPRSPELLVLNEPETSLHPDLLPSLARLIAGAAAHAQVVVVSHAARLIAALAEQPGCNELVLEKILGETQLRGQGVLDRPVWRWPPR